jgi:hypothetical protein
VVGIDHIPELVEKSRKNLDNDRPGLLESGKVKLIGKEKVTFRLCFHHISNMKLETDDLDMRQRHPLMVR